MKMQFVVRTTSAETNWRQKPISQPGRKHNKKAAMMMATSIAAFWPFSRLDTISCCWGLSALIGLPPIWSSTAFICLLAVMYTDTFRLGAQWPIEERRGAWLGKLSSFFQLNYFAEPIPARRSTPLVCKHTIPCQGTGPIESGVTYSCSIFVFWRERCNGFCISLKLSLTCILNLLPLVYLLFTRKHVCLFFF